MTGVDTTSIGSVFKAVFRNPALIRLELAWAAYNGADWAVWMCLLVYAYNAGGSIGLGAMALVQLVPCMLLAPYIGAYTDRQRPGHVLFAGYFMIGVSMAAVVSAMVIGSPAWVVFILSPLINLGITVPRPAHPALLPAVVHSPSELTAANVLSGWMDNVSMLIAPALAGVLLGIGGPKLAIAMLAVLSFTAAVLVLPVPGPPPVEFYGRRGSLTTQVLDGIRAVRSDKSLRLLVGLQASQYILVGALDMLFVVLAISVLGMGESGAGYLQSAVGAGGLVGASLTTLLVARQRLAPTLMAGVITVAFALVALGLYPTIISAFLLFAAAGLGRTVMDITGNILLQRSAGPHMLAYVFSLLESLMNIGLAIGSILVPILIELSGARAALIGTGILFFFIIALAWRGLRSVDAAATVPHVEIRLLQSIPIFSRLPAPQLEGLARALEIKTYNPGSVVICEGEKGDFYFAIADGEVEVKYLGETVARLTRGEGFGEIALIRDMPRMATVLTTRETKICCLQKEPFILALTGHLPTSNAAGDIVVRRLDRLRAVELRKILEKKKAQ
jgi:MFS family permease